MLARVLVLAQYTGINVSGGKIKLVLEQLSLGKKYVTVLLQT